VREALTAIRETSKGALADMRVTLSDLRAEDSDVEQAATRTAGLARLDVLCSAVRAAGAPVTVTVEGEPAALPPEADHGAYRILQESLTNVLRHAGPDASADVVLRYGPTAVTVIVTDDGRCPSTASAGAPSGAAGAAGATGPRTGGHGLAGGTGGTGGHGLAGMAERVTDLGGEFAAGPRPGGGFQVTARLPLTPAPTVGSEAGPDPAPSRAEVAAPTGPREAP